MAHIRTKIKKGLKAIARGRKTRKRLKLAKKAGKALKKLQRTRGHEKSAVEVTRLQRAVAKKRAKGLIKKIGKLNK